MFSSVICMIRIWQLEACRKLSKAQPIGRLQLSRDDCTKWNTKSQEGNNNSIVLTLSKKTYNHSIIIHGNLVFENFNYRNCNPWSNELHDVTQAKCSNQVLYDYRNKPIETLVSGEQSTEIQFKCRLVEDHFKQLRKT